MKREAHSVIFDSESGTSLVATIGKETFKNWNLSSIRYELMALCYADNVVYEKGEYHVIGKKTIATFVDRMLKDLEEINQRLNRDGRFDADIAHDRAVLQSLLKIKAS